MTLCSLFICNTVFTDKRIIHGFQPPPPPDYLGGVSAVGMRLMPAAGQQWRGQAIYALFLYLDVERPPEAPAFAFAVFFGLFVDCMISPLLFKLSVRVARRSRSAPPVCRVQGENVCNNFGFLKLL